jgi:hypothetical protein
MEFQIGDNIEKGLWYQMPRDILYLILVHVNTTISQRCSCPIDFAFYFPQMNSVEQSNLNKYISIHHSNNQKENIFWKLNQ